MSVIITDSNPEVSKGSRADYRLRLKSDYKPYYKELRPGAEPLLKKENNLAQVVEKYGLGGVNFGNWATMADRLNYVQALEIAMADLGKVTGFGTNIGLYKNLKISFGGRGVSSALAHYEPDTDFINLTRYKRGGNHKDVRFFATGGIGSFAHEYGHFIDFTAGKYAEPVQGIPSLSNCDSISPAYKNKAGTMRKQMDIILSKVMYKNGQSGEFTAYYKRLRDWVEQSPAHGNYWIRRGEIFARQFEAYVMLKLKKKGITNLLLTKSKYDQVYYPPTKDVLAIAPDIDKLLRMYKTKMLSN